MTRTQSAVATVCCVLAFAFSGCEREGAKPAAAVDPASPEARMADPVYRQQLSDLDAARKPLLRARAQVLSEIEALRVDVRAKLAGADAARVEAELAKRPAWAPAYLAVRRQNAGAAQGSRRKGCH